MATLNFILLTVFFCTIPAGVLWLCRRFKTIGKIGPVIILYAIGMIVGNIGIMPEQLPAVQDILSNSMIPLAIPLMLFSCTFRRSGTRSQILALLTGIISVAAAVIIGFFIFGKHIDEGAKIGGMLTGVYTGGTINLAALKTMLNVKDETYILINSYDILVSFLYLTFLLTVGIRLFRKILPDKRAEFTKEDQAIIQNELEKASENPYKGLFTKSGMKETAVLLCIALGICAVSGGIALLMPSGTFMTVFILLLTTFGIICSFIRPIKKMRYSYDIGMYLIYIFCITVASMANLSTLNLAGGLNLLGYLLAVVFGSLILQTIFAKIFRIDADLMVISSVTFINSPPFVPMMAAAMKNKDVLIPGLTIGVIGYAVGNYLGFLISQILSIC